VDTNYSDVISGAAIAPEPEDDAKEDTSAAE
jgi:hypothetical protein